VSCIRHLNIRMKAVMRMYTLSMVLRAKYDVLMFISL
jgi:hypothetical protein